MSLAGLQLFKKREKKVPEEVKPAAEEETRDDPPTENPEEQDTVCAETVGPDEAAHQDSPAEAEAAKPSAEKRRLPGSMPSVVCPGQGKEKRKNRLSVSETAPSGYAAINK